MAHAGPSTGVLLFVALIAGAGGGAVTALLLRPDAPPVRSDRGYDDSDLRKRIRELHADVQRALQPAEPAPPVDPSRAPADESKIEVEEPTEGGDASAAPANGKKAFVVSAFVESLRGHRFTLEDSDRLTMRLSLEKEKIGPTIEALEKAIAADPSNPELYAALGSAHVAKLAAGVAVGAAAAPVFGEAMQAYDKALQLDPDHWDARYSKAFTTSMAPPFLGFRPTSIRMFEDLVQRQAALPKQDSFSRTYMRLGALYKDAGNTKKAKEIWTKGLQLFPDDDKMRDALEVLDQE